MSAKVDDKLKAEREGYLRELADNMIRKQPKDRSLDQVSLESRRRSIAYGRARGNA